MLNLIRITLIICVIEIIAITICVAFKKEDLATDVKVSSTLSIIALLLIQAITYRSHETKIKEKAVIEFVEGSITYDTLSMDKTGNILEIKLIEK